MFIIMFHSPACKLAATIGRRVRPLLSYLTLSAATASFSRAEILFYDGFHYDPGEDALEQQLRWAVTRTPGASSDVVAGNLTYVDGSGNTLHSAGNHVRVDTVDEGPQTENLSDLDLQSPFNPQGNVRWLSVVMQKLTPSLRVVGVSLRGLDNVFDPPDTNTTPDEFLNIGTNTNQDPQNFRIVNRAQAGTFTSSATSPISAYTRSFLLVKIEMNVDGTDRERYTLWVNPGLATEPAAGSGFSFTSLRSDFAAWSDVKVVRITAGEALNGQPATDMLVDELRIGETFADVTPHEPSFAVTMSAPDAQGAIEVVWPAKEGRTDVLEYTDGVLPWTAVRDGTRSGAGEPGKTEHEVKIPGPLILAPGEPQRIFFRVRRQM